MQKPLETGNVVGFEGFLHDSAAPEPSHTA